MSYETSGGECPQGPCGFKAQILRDGRVVRSDGMAQTVDVRPLARLAGRWHAADWEAILARPFEGECPKNFDGQEETYTFNVAPEPVVVASCTTPIDPSRTRSGPSRGSCSASAAEAGSPPSRRGRTRDRAELRPKSAIGRGQVSSPRARMAA